LEEVPRVTKNRCVFYTLWGEAAVAGEPAATPAVNRGQENGS
jgi:hypothetical protein